MTGPRELRPFVRKLEAPGGEGHLPLLTEEVASRMRAGLVTLAPGEKCGRHSTEAFEELLIVFAGRGEAALEGYGTYELEAGRAFYIPPYTVHDVASVGEAELRYLYVVCSAF